jgi:O-antigen/teichoic acid export membrane protein
MGMTAKEGAPRLVDHWTVARSALWNIAGRAGPMVVAIVATPFLFADLGPARWGLFTLALSLIGIFGIFDFGIGRALTKLLAENLALGETERAARLTRTGLVLLTLFGVAGALILAALAHVVTEHALHIPPAQHDEVVGALYVLCIAVPFVILNAALWGVIAAFQKFREANLVNMPILAFYYIGPLIVLRFVDSLVAVMLVLVFCRIVLTVFYWRICIAEMPSLLAVRSDWRCVRQLSTLAGWMTVSNVAWPLLTYIDRFIVAAVVSAAAAGYYATPSDLLSRFSLISVAVMGTAFPAMAASFQNHETHTTALVRRSIVAISTVLFVPTLVVVAFSHELLTLWVGKAFADPAAPVLQWLGLAVIFSAADSVISGFIDSIGRPDVNAKFSIAELILYVPILFGLLSLFGIEGAALAWTLRIGIDLVLRVAIAGRLYPAVRPALIRTLTFAVVATLALCLPLFMTTPLARLAVMAASAGVFVVGLWIWGLSDDERLMATTRLRLRAAT